MRKTLGKGIRNHREDLGTKRDALLLSLWNRELPGRDALALEHVDEVTVGCETSVASRIWSRIAWLPWKYPRAISSISRVLSLLPETAATNASTSAGEACFRRIN